MDFNQFWNNMGPGLLNLGVGAYDAYNAKKTAQQRLAASQTPFVNTAASGATGMLNSAVNMSPDAAAADRFNAQEALLAGPQAKDLADLQRSLYAKGMLGAANYNPGVQGIAPGTTAMSPQLAAFYAAQNADRAKRATMAMDQGQQFQTNQINNAAALQRASQGAQTAQLNNLSKVPSNAGITSQLLQGAVGMLGKNPGIIKDLWNWGSGLFGGGDNLSFLGGYTPGADFVW